LEWNQVTLTESTNVVNEGDTVTYTVEAGEDVADDTTLTVSAQGDDLDGAAQAASSDDFSISTGEVTLSAGESTTFTVDAATDTENEPLEGIQVSLLDDDFQTVASETTGIRNVATGETFNLSNPDSSDGATDDITGTAQNDTFRGVRDEAFGDSDILDGAGGTDELITNQTVGANPSNGDDGGDTIAGATENIEEVFLDASFEDGNAGNTDFTFDLDNMSGVQTLVNDGSSNTTNDSNTETLILDNVSFDTTVGIRDTGVATQVNYADTSGDNTAELRVDGVASETAGTSGNDDGQASDITADGVETFDITSAGDASTLSNLSGDSVETVNVSGSADFTVSGLSSNITTVDASNLEAALDITAGSTDLSVTGTANDDTFSFGGNLGSGDTVVGGDGDDTLSVQDSSNVSSSAFTNVSEVEELAVADNGDAQVNVTDLGDAFEVVNFAITDNGDTSSNFDVTADGLSSGNQVNVTSANLASTGGANVDGINALGTTTLNLSDASASDDSLTLNMNNNNTNADLESNVSDFADTDGTFESNTVAAAGVETFTVNSTGDLGPNQVTNLNLDDATTVNVTGSQDVTIGDADSTTANGLSTGNLSPGDTVTVDASDAGGQVTFEAANEDREHDVTGSAQDDTFIFTNGQFDDDDVVGGGDGDDSLTVAGVNGDIGDVQLSNVETATFNLTSGSADTIGLAAASGLQTANVDADLNQAVTIEGADADTEVAVTNVTGSGADLTVEGQTGVSELDLALGQDGLDGFDGDERLSTDDGQNGGNGQGVSIGSDAFVIDSSITDASITVEGEGGSGGTAANNGTDGTDGTDTASDLDQLTATGLTSLTLNLSNSQDFTVDDLNAEDLETLTLEGGSTSDSVDTVQIDADDGTSDTSSLSTVDASGLSASLTLGSDANGEIQLASGASVTGSAQSDSIFWNGNSQSGVELDAGNNGSGGDTLNLTGSQNIGGGIIDLSQDDQVSQFNGTSNDAVQTGFENVDASAVTANGNAINMTGNSADNTFVGTSAGDIIDGGGGSDTVDYSSGNLSPGAVSVTLDGSNQVTATNGGADGNDTLSNVENVIGAGSNDSLVGDSNDNRLVGNGGDDTLTGNGGDDTLVVDSNDTSIDGGAGVDTLETDGATTVAAGDADNFEVIDIASDASHNITTGDISTVDNTNQQVSVTNSSGDDVTTGITIDGSGLTGSDNLLFDGDTQGFTGGDTVDGGAAADELIGGEGGDTLNGNGANDTIEGGAGDDTIDGGAGDDTITGGDGSDSLTGSGGADTFVFEDVADSPGTTPGTDEDTIADFASGTDTIDLSAISLSTDTSSILDKGNIGGDTSFNTSANASNYFDDGGTDRAVAFEHDGTNGRVVVDANGNGDFDTDSDMIIALTGVTTAPGTGDFDFG